MHIILHNRSRRRPGLFATVVLFLSLLTGGCSSQPPQIMIEGQYAELSPALFGVGSVFMTIRNSGGGDAVTGISVNVPGAIIELHDVKNRRMVKVEKIAVPARGTTELKPGGLHIMIFNMPRTTREGSDIVLTLVFERSGQREVAVRLEKPRELPSSDR